MSEMDLEVRDDIEQLDRILRQQRYSSYATVSIGVQMILTIITIILVIYNNKLEVSMMIVTATLTVVSSAFIQEWGDVLLPHKEFRIVSSEIKISLYMLLSTLTLKILDY